MKKWMTQNTRVIDKALSLCLYALCIGVILFMSHESQAQSPKQSLHIILSNNHYKTNFSDTTYFYEIKRGLRKKIKLTGIYIQKGDSIIEEYVADSKKITFQKTQITESRIIKNSEIISTNEKDVISPFRSYTLFWKNLGNYILVGTSTSSDWQKADSIIRHFESPDYSVDSLFTFKEYSSSRLLSQVNIQQDSAFSNYYFYGYDQPSYSIHTSNRNSQLAERWEVPSTKKGEERIKNEFNSFETIIPIITNSNELDKLPKGENRFISPSLLHPRSKWRVDDSFLLLIREFGGRCGNNQLLNPTLCLKLVDLANHKLAKDSVYMPEVKYNFTMTTTKILMVDYGLLQVDFIGGDFIPRETLCFDEVMEDFIEAKYGDSFFTKTMEYADSLDKLRLGYIAPKPIKYSSVEECFKVNFKNKKTLFEDDDLMFVISFFIDENGEISDMSFYEGLNSTGEMHIIKDSDQIREFQRVMDELGKWSPARLRNIPMKEKQVYVINHWNMR